jgi:hypothetical protein
MKERLLLPVSILIGAVLILIGLTALSNTIQNRPLAGTPNYPSYYEVPTKQADEYMSAWEASAYLRIDNDSFEKLLDEGKLKGTYIEIAVEKTVPDEQAYEEMNVAPEDAPTPAMPAIKVPGVERVFFKIKLDEWMLTQISQ